MADGKIKVLLDDLDAHLAAIFKLIERLGAEARMDDAAIDAILAEGDRDSLEVITDTAAEVALKVMDRVVDARLAILGWRTGR